MIFRFDQRNKPYTFVRYIANNMKKEEVFTEEQKTIARFAKAMGNPIRLYVLELLSNQSCCYSGDLTEVLPIAKSTLSQHLKELKDAQIITMTKSKNKIYIEPNIETMKEIAECFSVLVEEYEKGTVFQFDNTK